MTSRRPFSIQALTARSRPTGYDPSKSLIDLLRIATAERDAGQQAKAANDVESAFIHFAKASTLILEEIPTHPRFDKLTQSLKEAVVVHGQMIDDSLGAIKLLVTRRTLDWRTRVPDPTPVPTSVLRQPTRGPKIQQQLQPRPSPQDTHEGGQQALWARQHQEAREFTTGQEHRERSQGYKQWDDSTDASTYDQVAKTVTTRDRERKGQEEEKVRLEREETPAGKQRVQEAAMNSATAASFLGYPTPALSHTRVRPKSYESQAPTSNQLGSFQSQSHRRLPPPLLAPRPKRHVAFFLPSSSEANHFLPAPVDSSRTSPGTLASGPLQEVQSLRVQPQAEHQHGSREDYYSVQLNSQREQHHMATPSRTDLFGSQIKSALLTSELDASKQRQPNTLSSVWDQIPQNEFGVGLHSQEDPTNTTNKVYSAMPIDDIIALLVVHQCPDITSRLDLKKCGATAFAGGGFGDVYHGALDKGERVAIKCARFYIRQGDAKGHKVLKHAAREIYTWSCLKHANIVELLGLAQFRDHLAMVSPWMDNGTLLEHLERNPAADRYRLITEITDGVVYLHQNDTIHGDIKGASIHGIIRLH
ncbi:hypothetical protein FRC09_018501 [Ceratobasidium sp. 395]|nr:hypothetical protein FRC09_018501 [Ceratobasidium sp. 395]